MPRRQVPAGEGSSGLRGKLPLRQRGRMLSVDEIGGRFIGLTARLGEKRVIGGQGAGRVGAREPRRSVQRPGSGSRPSRSPADRRSGTAQHPLRCRGTAKGRR